MKNNVIIIGSIIALCFIPLVYGVGWDSSTISVETDKYSYYTGDTVTIQITGYDRDANETNNVKSLDVAIQNFTTTVYKWTSQTIGTKTKLTLEYTIPATLYPSHYYVYVYDNATKSALTHTSFYVSKKQVSIDVSTDDYSYYVGDTMTIYVKRYDDLAETSIVDVSIKNYTTTIYKWSAQTIEPEGKITLEYKIPPTLYPSTYSVYVYDNATETILDYTSFYVSKKYVSIDVVLHPGKYGGYYYVPGEELKFDVHADANATYTVNITSKDWKLVEEWKNVMTDMDGMASLSYSIPDTIKDGSYVIYVIDSSGYGYYGDSFSIQTYMLSITSDRKAYIFGETVSIYYTATMIKDHSLLKFGYVSWELYESQKYGGQKKIDSGKFQSNTGTGTISIKIPSEERKYAHYYVYVWFNSSADKPEHTASSYLSLNIGELSTSIEADQSIYPPDGIVIATVKSFVEGDYHDYPIPDCDISKIEVFKKTTGDWISQQLFTSLKTDLSGSAKVVFKIPKDIEDNSQLKIDVNISKGSVKASDTTTVIVKKSTDISVSVFLDWVEYLSGETMNIKVETQSITGEKNFTYIYEIIAEDFNILKMEASNSNELKFTIPDNFEGDLDVSVIAYGANGGVGYGIAKTKVNYARIVLNVIPATYHGGERVKAEFQVMSKLMIEATYHYKITALGGEESYYYGDTWVVVAEGDISVKNNKGSFTFDIPKKPANSYKFTVYGSRQGKVVESSFVIQKAPSYALQIKLDKEVYKPGETMKIHYKLLIEKGAPAVEDISILYGIGPFPTQRYTTTKTEGDLRYTIPGDIGEGDYIFTMVVYSGEYYYYQGAQASSSSIVTVTKSPLGIKTTTFDWFLFTIFIVSLIIGVIVLIRTKAMKRFPQTQYVPSYQQPYQPPAQPPLQPSYQEPYPTPTQPPKSPIEPIPKQRPPAVLCGRCRWYVKIPSTYTDNTVSCPHCGSLLRIE
ncbi:MAG: hypothetical protein AB1779_00965 [Candidatus Thermoplasmatota archaeon]